MLPAIDESLRTARLSYAKVRALTRVATPENEAKLLEMALIATGAQLERLCRGYRGVLDSERTPAPEERSVRQRLLPGGMVKLELVLEPDEADLILRAIERAREVHARQAEPLETEAPSAPAVAAEPALPAAQGETEAAEAAGVSAETCWPSRADGAVKLAESFLAGNPVTGTGGERFQVMVHLDQEVLGPDGAWAGTLEDGTRVSAETLRRVACDCGLVATGGDGEALNSGETSLDNLVMLCTFHHHLVHEGGWAVTAGADSVFTFHSPAGTLLAPEPPRELVNDTLDWLRKWADESNLYLGHNVNMPQWDGKTPDYDGAVGWLLAAGQ
jgi:hypothetical protein